MVDSADQKLEALRAFTEHVVPGRWAEVRPPSRQELQGTLVLSLPLTEASAKRGCPRRSISQFLLTALRRWLLGVDGTCASAESLVSAEVGL